MSEPLERRPMRIRDLKKVIETVPDDYLVNFEYDEFGGGYSDDEEVRVISILNSERRIVLKSDK